METVEGRERPNRKTQIGDSQGETQLQGKFDKIRGILLLANGTTPEISYCMLPAPLIDQVNNFTPVSPPEITQAL